MRITRWMCSLIAQGTRLHRRGRVHVTRSDGGIWVGGDTVIGVTGEVDFAAT